MWPAGLVDRRDDLRTEQEAVRFVVPGDLRSDRLEAGDLGCRAAPQARARQLSNGLVVAAEIRGAMVRPNRQPLSGEVEIDESYVGGPEPGKPGRGAEEKAIVTAAVEKRGRGCGRVRLGLVPNVSAAALIGFVEKHLGHGETAHTDGWRGYAKLGKTGYQHIVSVLSQLDQTAAEVLPRVHLIFSLLRRWILGTHQGSVSFKHLDGYLDEFTFRFNRRLARRITHGANRLLGIAMATPSRPFWKIVGRTRPRGKARTRRFCLTVMETHITALAALATTSAHAEDLNDPGSWAYEGCKQGLLARVQRDHPQVQAIDIDGHVNEEKFPIARAHSPERHIFRRTVTITI